MGLFNRLGRQVEEFRQTAKQAADEHADFECAACGERYAVPKDACEECGAEAVERAEDAE
ncbi:hypothetical protein ACKVMT_08430 [Halobacteriales archaeon Cl-PHB]